MRLGVSRDIRVRCPAEGRLPLSNIPGKPQGGIIMNVWKPIAVLATAGLIASVGMQVASAQANIGNCHNQGNMMAAAKALYAARDSLNKAEHNKGGWRDRAIAATTNAIAETEKGCAFADTH
jgi:hypothetical protein